MLAYPVEKEVTNLIIEDDDLLSFQIPSYQEVCSAYSTSYQDDTPIPTKTKYTITPVDDDESAFTIEKDNDELYF